MNYYRKNVVIGLMLIVGLMILFSGSTVWAQVQRPYHIDSQEFEDHVTSDFGPRNVVGGSNFHRGTDFRARLDQHEVMIDDDTSTRTFTRTWPLYALEGGEITQLNFQGDKGFFMNIEADNDRTWEYFHLFEEDNGGVQDCEPIWIRDLENELDRNVSRSTRDGEEAVFAEVRTQVEHEGRIWNVIVFLDEDTRPVKAVSNEPNIPIRRNTGCSERQDDQDTGPPDQVPPEEPPGQGPPNNQPNQGPPEDPPPENPRPVNPPNPIHTENQVDQDELISVSGATGTAHPHLHVGVWQTDLNRNADDIPDFNNSSHFNPMSLITAENLTNRDHEDRYQREDINGGPAFPRGPTPAGPNAPVGGDLRIQTRFDATHRYDLDEVELRVQHTNDDYMEEAKLLGEPSDQQATAQHPYDTSFVRFGGVRDEQAIPKQIRPGHSNTLQPWANITHQQQETFTGINPVEDQEGMYRFNYNIFRNNEFGLAEDEAGNDFTAMYPGLHDLTITVTSANGDEFEYEDEFHIHGFILEGTDETGQTLPEGTSPSSFNCDRTTPNKTLELNENGRAWANGQPNQDCRIVFPDESEPNRENEVEVTIQENEDDPVEEFTLVLDRSMEGSVETVGGGGGSTQSTQSGGEDYGGDGFTIRYEPIGPNADEIREKIDQHEFKTEKTFGPGEDYTLEAFQGRYKVTLSDPDREFLVVGEDSSDQPEFQATQEVYFPKRSWEQGPETKTVHWEAAKPGEVQVHVKKCSAEEEGKLVNAQFEEVTVESYSLKLGGDHSYEETLETGYGANSGKRTFPDYQSNHPGLPPGRYRAEVDLDRNYNESFELSAGESKSIKLGPDSSSDCD